MQLDNAEFPLFLGYALLHNGDSLTAVRLCLLSN